MGAEAPLEPDAVAAMLTLPARLHAQWWGRADLNQFNGWQDPMRVHALAVAAGTVGGVPGNAARRTRAVGVT
jgi:hypothetical protein